MTKSRLTVLLALSIVVISGFVFKTVDKVPAQTDNPGDFCTIVDSILQSNSRDDLLNYLWTDKEGEGKEVLFWNKKEFTVYDFALLQSLFEISDGIYGEQLSKRVYDLLKDSRKLGNSFLACINTMPAERKYRTQYFLYLDLYFEMCWEYLDKDESLSPSDGRVSEKAFLEAFPFIPIIDIPKDTIVAWSGYETLFQAAQSHSFS